ncbi:MAG TPA: Spy/CpxP family protein refolding chaperone [Candidatus Aminicenantes bacterium]|nr:Spy/CpxP family protein refolding chaperone [Candidatus Aminicenantes bacterium]
MLSKKMVVLTTAIVFTSLLLISPLTAAEDCHKKACDKTAKTECGKAPEQKGCMLAQIPNLTPEQKAKFEKMHADMQKAMAEQKAAMQKQHQEMQELMKKGEIKAIEAKIDEISKLQADMMKKAFANRLAVRALLTDEQKAGFDKMACGPMMNHCGMKGQGACGMEKKGQCDKEKKGACDKEKMEQCDKEKKGSCNQEKKGECTAKKPVEPKKTEATCGDDCSKCEKTEK